MLLEASIDKMSVYSGHRNDALRERRSILVRDGTEWSDPAHKCSQGTNILYILTPAQYVTP